MTRQFFAKLHDNYRHSARSVSTITIRKQHPDGLLLAVRGTIRTAVDRWYAEQALNAPVRMGRSGTRKLPRRSPSIRTTQTGKDECWTAEGLGWPEVRRLVGKVEDAAAEIRQTDYLRSDKQKKGGSCPDSFMHLRIYQACREQEG